MCHPITVHASIHVVSVAMSSVVDWIHSRAAEALAHGVSIANPFVLVSKSKLLMACVVDCASLLPDIDEDYDCLPPGLYAMSHRIEDAAHIPRWWQDGWYQGFEQGWYGAIYRIDYVVLYLAYIGAPADDSAPWYKVLPRKVYMVESMSTCTLGGLPHNPLMSYLPSTPAWQSQCVLVLPHPDGCRVLARHRVQHAISHALCLGVTPPPSVAAALCKPTSKRCLLDAMTHVLGDEHGRSMYRRVSAQPVSLEHLRQLIRVLPLLPECIAE